MKKFYITTAIDYLNGPPHLGHALEKIQADAIARSERLAGKEVYFLTGTDDHGIKIVRSAETAGKKVRDFADANADKFIKLVKSLNISSDDFIRTSDQKRHWPGAQKLWQKLLEAGDIYKSKYKGYYCVGCEAYVTERDLVNGKCPYHDKEPEFIEEENYFFKLSKYSKEIKNKIKNDELKIIPRSRKNEVLSMMDGEIFDISFSRPREKLSWGVPVPNDDFQIMYVWCDALSNYISALGYGTENDLKFKKYWPADMHIIGKDILRFHAIVWPAMLMSAGLDLPKRIFVHGFILSGGKRMSKTAGNVIDPFELINEYGTDAFRYYFLREITPFEDGNITREKFKEVYNANLANGLGNLVARIMKMAESYLDSSVGIPQKDGESMFVNSYNDYKKLMASFELNKAMDIIWNFISQIDLHIQKEEPFKLFKTDPEKAKAIVEHLVYDLYEVAMMLRPFMPETSEKILKAIETNKMPPTLFARK